MTASDRETGTLEIEPAFAAPLRDAGLADFAALAAVRGDASLPKAGLADWRERIVLTVGGRTLYLKRYRRPPLGVQMRLRLAGYACVAAVERRWLRALPALGIGAPELVAYGRHGATPFERASLVVTAAVPGESLERWVPDALGGPLADREFRRRLLAATADVVRRLHGAGLVHRDLYLSHVFVAVGPDGAITLTLIDLQRLRRLRLRRRRWLVKDLAALHYSTPPAAASRTDRLRWWRRYRGTARLDDAEKAFLRAIDAKAARIARHDANRRARAADAARQEGVPENSAA